MILLNGKLFVVNYFRSKMIDDKIRRLVVFGGESGAGKTSICIHQMTGKMPTEYIPTNVDNFLEKDCLINEKTVSVLFSDYEEGGEDWNRLRHLGYKEADCVVLCFSVSSPRSFANIKDYWYPFTKEHCPKAKLILIGMKIDLRDDQETIDKLAKLDLVLVTYKEGKKLSKDIKAKCYLECSSLRSEGIEDVFNKAAEVASAEKTDDETKGSKSKRCCLM